MHVCTAVCRHRDGLRGEKEKKNYVGSEATPYINQGKDLMGERCAK